jgi:hypothetical protein
VPAARGSSFRNLAFFFARGRDSFRKKRPFFAFERQLGSHQHFFWKYPQLIENKWPKNEPKSPYGKL